MRLAPREVEKLMLHNAGYLAQKRLARGLRLNYTEAVALIATQILEFVHDGDKSVAELMNVGRQLLGRRQVLPAVPHLLDSVQGGKWMGWAGSASESTWVNLRRHQVWLTCNILLEKTKYYKIRFPI
ncbi:hypothetical protein L1987_37872 [Smallanthus sonchifolius]|uniref:Uncharacterized protein n=1 Tax=Smallanthus sonchifolius TaxID=185202 RepID=A0ACB9HIG2_9ASTR|nr:hypothetical protein L1987_37872 [Smallanthus sonchifolius]